MVSLKPKTYPTHSTGSCVRYDLRVVIVDNCSLTSIVIRFI